MPQQQLTITVHFKTEHKPGTPDHLAVILENYLRAKGVMFNREGLVIEI